MQIFGRINEARNVGLAGKNKVDAIGTCARLIEDESGQDMIEYALVAALISLGAVASIKALAPVISNAYNSVGNKLSSNI